MPITAAEIEVGFETRGLPQVLGGLGAVDAAANRIGGSTTKGAAGTRGLGMGLGILAAGAGIAAGAAVNMAKDFETTFLTMGAVAGVPEEGLARLKEVALDAGAATAFSANEAADSMLNLAKAGLNVDQVTASLMPTLHLAAAGELELGDAATITANALNTFGLRARDVGRVTDALAGAANASSADVSDLSLALSQGGTAASMAGLSIEETTAALAALADQGIRGSDAGTSLKTMLLNLNPVTARQRETMSALNLDFTDAAGNFLDLEGIAGQLRSRLDHLTQSERLLALETIFGSDAIRAANTLYKEGAKGIRAYTEETSDAGVAAEVAAAKQAGFDGAMERLGGSIATAAQELFTKILPALTGIANIGTAVVNFFMNMPGPVNAVVKPVAILTVGLIALAATSTGLKSLVSTLKGLTIMQTLGGYANTARMAVANMATAMIVSFTAAGGGAAGLKAALLALATASGPLLAVTAAIGAGVAMYKAFSDAHAAEAELMATSVPFIEAYGKATEAGVHTREDLIRTIEREIQWLKDEGANEQEVAAARAAGEEALNRYDSALKGTIRQHGKLITVTKEGAQAAFNFAGMTYEEFSKWEAGTRGAFGGASSAISKFAGKARVSLRSIDKAIGKQIEAQRNFNQNLGTLLDRGLAEKFPALARTIQEGGLEMAGVVATLAKSNERDFSRIGRATEKTERLGDRAMSQLGTHVLGFETKTESGTAGAANSWQEFANRVSIAAADAKASISSIPTAPGSGGGGYGGTTNPPVTPGEQRFAHGGVVTGGGMRAVIGEGGREAVIPLSTDRGIDYLAKALTRAIDGGGQKRRRSTMRPERVSEEIILSVDGYALSRATRRRDQLHGRKVS